MHDYFTISTVHYSAVTYIIHLTNGKKEITKGVALSLTFKKREFLNLRNDLHFGFVLFPLLTHLAIFSSALLSNLILSM